MTKRQAAKLMREAAKLLDAHGWRKGKYGDCEEGFCLVGALNKAGITLGVIRPSLWALFNMSPFNWNDAPGRTKEEVTGLLRRRARELEHGGYFGPA